MFFVGLFSTNLPYIILSIGYLIGFGLYSTNTVLDKLAEKNNSSEQIIECQSFENLVSSQASIAYSYATHWQHQTQQATQPAADELQFSVAQSVQYIDFKQFEIDYTFVSFSFLRPPPAFQA
jgi:hypothetical protein